MNVLLASNLQEIREVERLERLGSGHDGKVYKYRELALKLLKYDIEQRKEKGLLSFEKANYFVNECMTKRITMPQDILLDESGIYTGIVMECIDKVEDSSRFFTEDFYISGLEIKEDVDKLSENRVGIKDINRGSFIIGKDFLHICDVDKFIDYRKQSKVNVEMLNRDAYNFLLSKFIVLNIMERIKRERNLTKEERTTLNRWVKYQVKKSKMLTYIEQELKDPNQLRFEDFIETQKQKILR